MFLTIRSALTSTSLYVLFKTSHFLVSQLALILKQVPKQTTRPLPNYTYIYNVALISKFILSFTLIFSLKTSKFDNKLCKKKKISPLLTCGGSKITHLQLNSITQQWRGILKVWKLHTLAVISVVTNTYTFLFCKGKRWGNIMYMTFTSKFPV